MSRRFAISAACVVALASLAAAQQPNPKKEIDSLVEKAAQTAPDKKADPTDAAIAAALRNDPDVKIAQAKIQLAEAELAKAKQTVVVKVMPLVAKVRQLRTDVEQYRERAAWAARMVKLAYISQQQEMAERMKLEQAQAALAAAETELKLLTGDERGALKAWLGEVTPPDHDSTVAQSLRYLSQLQRYERSFDAQVAAASLLASIDSRHAVKGPIPDRIRAALDKPVKLAAKGESVTFEKALEVFRKAGLDVPVRGALPRRYQYDPENPPKNPNEMKSVPIEIVSEGEDLPVGAWFQLFEDNAVFPQRGGKMTRFRFYVREYGLLVSSSDAAPPDAPTLTDFWKQKPPASAKSETAPDPKSK